MIQSHLSQTRLRFIVGIGLCFGLLVQCHHALSERSSQPETKLVAHRGPSLLKPNEAFASLSRDEPVVLQPTLEHLAASDPVGFFEMVLKRYDRSVRDYTCVFSKQELVGGKLTPKQVMKAWFREDPFSVQLQWIENRDKAARVLYVADRWVTNGQQMAVVEPGPIARLFVPYVMRPIHGQDAMNASRRTIDQFGFRNNAVLVMKYCRQAAEQGVLDFTFRGTPLVDGRETLLFERHLPYTGENGPWPDRVLQVYVDREWLVPTLCVAYADDAKTKLLGRYQYTDLKLNASLPDSVFTKQGMGL